MTTTDQVLDATASALSALLDEWDHHTSSPDHPPRSTGISAAYHARGALTAVEDHRADRCTTTAPTPDEIDQLILKACDLLAAHHVTLAQRAARRDGKTITEPGALHTATRARLLEEHDRTARRIIAAHPHITATDLRDQLLAANDAPATDPSDHHDDNTAPADVARTHLAAARARLQAADA